MTGIFISYRRGATSHIAGRLHDRLCAEFGQEHIFRDVDTIRPGVDFVEQIADAVSACGALIAVIGDDWLGTDAGGRRIDDPDDFVRIELAAALARDVLVVPVLVENARMPSKTELPEPLKRLARLNAIAVTDSRWNYEMAKLIDALQTVLARTSASPREVAIGYDRGPDIPELDSHKPIGEVVAQPFRLTMAQAYYHPRFDGFYLQVLADTLFVTGIPPTGQNEFIILSGVPVGEWIELRDRSGRATPAAILRTEAGELYGAWR